MICYVLNLERHHARLQAFLQQFDRSDLSASELRRFRAVDAASVWPQARALVYEPALARLAAVERRGFRQTHAEMPSRGGVGCALNHLCTWLDVKSVIGRVPAAASRADKARAIMQMPVVCRARLQEVRNDPTWVGIPHRKTLLWTE